MFLSSPHLQHASVLLRVNVGLAILQFTHEQGLTLRIGLRIEYECIDILYIIVFNVDALLSSGPWRYRFVLYHMV